MGRSGKKLTFITLTIPSTWNFKEGAELIYEMLGALRSYWTNERKLEGLFRRAQEK